MWKCVMTWEWRKTRSVWHFWKLENRWFPGKEGVQSPCSGREDELAGDFLGNAVSHFYGQGGKESRFYRGGVRNWLSMATTSETVFSNFFFSFFFLNMFKTYGGKERKHMEWDLKVGLGSREMVGETITCFRSRGWLKMSHCFFMLLHLPISICWFFVVCSNVNSSNCLMSNG